MKSNEEWPLQLWTQLFMQLRKKPEKKKIQVRRSNQLSYKATDVAGGQAIFEWKRRLFFQIFAILTWFLILGKIHPRRRPRWRSLLVTSQASSSATTHKLYFIL